MSTFSEQGSFRMTSGAIQATVPANDITVDFSFHSRLVPKSDIFTMSFLAIKTLQSKINIINTSDTHSELLEFLQYKLNLPNYWVTLTCTFRRRQNIISENLIVFLISWDN